MRIKRQPCALCTRNFKPTRPGNVYCSRACTVRAADLRCRGLGTSEPGYYKEYMRRQEFGITKRYAPAPFSSRVRIAQDRVLYLYQQAVRNKHPATEALRVAYSNLRLAVVEIAKEEIRVENEAKKKDSA